MILVQCWIEHPVRSLDQTFTYLYDRPLTAGTRVQVFFNRRLSVGFVESAQETNETKEQIEERLGMKLQTVQSVLDEQSLITDELHDLAMWMSKTTLSTVISCFQAMLPAKVKPHTGTQKAVTEKWVSVSEAAVELTPKQLEAYAFVRDNQPMLYSRLRSEYPNQASILIRKGALTEQVKERTATIAETAELVKPLLLTEDQQTVKDEIESSSDSVFLLRGVTGAGKTEVYLQIAKNILDRGKQVLILVPEISLTPQMIERVSSRFGNDLAIYHSALNAQEKYEQYRMVMTGKARVVVGTRSAVFLPFTDLGLIVMDEEQDSSYKQENQPAYHCRDIAIWRGQYHHCKVILGSATPSLDSYARALKNVYHLVSLSKRINLTLPDTVIVPMKQCMKQGQSYILSDTLIQKMEERLKKKEQCILLLNRRGYHAVMRCRSCQTPVICPHCDLAMSYHRDERIMKCHACGYQMKLPAVCPSCGSREGYSAFGYGTQKLEQILQEKFPEARLLRMDADTTSVKNGHASILDAFSRHEADILLGTQMIAKGLDYPNVTLVGILNGDEGLNRTDFRSCETTFDLLMQAAGRSGRSNVSGEVVFQVFDPDHYAVQCAAAQDYELFFKYEMQFRHAGQYPPYTYLISLTAVNAVQSRAEKTALWLKQNLNGSYKTIGVISLLKIQDRYRYRIILKGRDLEQMRNDVRQALEQKECPDVSSIRIDVNPTEMD